MSIVIYKSSTSPSNTSARNEETLESIYTIKECKIQQSHSVSINTHPKSLPHVIGGSLHHKGMDDQCIVNVDKERQFLFPTQTAHVHSLQFCCSSYVPLKFFTCTNPPVVYRLKEV